MQIGDNQTSEDVLRNLTALAIGSGVFAVPDPTLQELAAISKVVVSGITYPDCVQRGLFCIAFKWVPKKLDESLTTCPTSGALCAKTCAHELCLCVNGTCR